MCSGPRANSGGRSRRGPGQCCSGLQGGAESGGRRAERSSAPIAAAQPATEARRRAHEVAAQEDLFTTPRNYSMLKPFKVIAETLEAPWMGFVISRSLLWSQGNLDQRTVEGDL